MIEWKISDTLVPYPEAVTFMEERVQAIQSGHAKELVWLLEHPPLYTAGTSSKASDLIDPGKFPVFETGRGGQFTYHGPGQRVVYVMIDLKRRSKDVRAFVNALEEWVIQALKGLGISGEVRSGRVGIWVDTPQGEKKIAAIGVRLRQWVSFHGIAINVSPDLSHFSGIVPCGISQFGVTSFMDLGLPVTLAQVDQELQKTWGESVFLGKI